MSGKQHADLGDIQETLFAPVTARAAETRRRHPVLRDPKAVEIVESVQVNAAYAVDRGGFTMVTRTLILDEWAREFLAEHPAGTVIELGTGLNTRFERVGNGACHWIDLDLPDTIELRRRFFADAGRRQMLAASVLDPQWHDIVAECPGPYFFACEGVLIYLDEEKVKSILRETARRFPASRIAFDLCGRRLLEQQHRSADRRGMAAKWAWSCDDPGAFGASAGLELALSLPVTRPPARLRRELPLRYRARLRLADPVIGKTFTVNLFRPFALPDYPITGKAALPGISGVPVALSVVRERDDRS
jgi:O-methyltransferase involved in polyketide biosynthesis